MIALLKDAGVLDGELRKNVEKVYKTCKICHMFHRKAGKPKVGLPKARKVNETVSLDLKPAATVTGKKDDKRQIVYMVDEMSRFTAAGVSKTKEATKVIDVILKRWCLNGLG